MFPWGHAAVAYLLLAASRRHRGVAVTAGAAVAVLLASQLPDLIDKPLSWYLPLLPSGRSLAHSFLTGSLILGGVVAVLAALGARRLLLPVAIGFLSHPLADTVGIIAENELHFLTYLGWPILPLFESDGGPEGLVDAFAGADVLAPLFLLELGLVILAVAVWYEDGRPGLGLLRRTLRRGRHALEN